MPTPAPLTALRPCGRAQCGQELTPRDKVRSPRAVRERFGSGEERWRIFSASIDDLGMTTCAQFGQESWTRIWILDMLTDKLGLNMLN
eukprot:scaffold5500_cov84-Phaeocystis_antarctica.AAC.1